MNTRRVSVLFFALFAALCALSLASLRTGFADMGFTQMLRVLSGSEKDEVLRTLLFEIRLPRLFAGIFAGASLAAAGAAMQTLFRNPLADPSITGVSSGAALGAAVSIFLFSSAFISLQLFALAFGLAAAFAVWRLGRVDGRISAFSMLLAGIAVNAFCGALVGYAMYGVREAGLKGFIFWSLGSLDGASWGPLAAASAVASAAWLVLMLNARGLNMLTLGREGAYHSGADVGRLQMLAVLCASLMTASCVALCGVIGFVGLVVPHIVRMLSGPDNRSLIPLSSLGGACLLVFADIISRLANPTDNVPIGVITALIGAPFFIFLLRRPGNAGA